MAPLTALLGGKITSSMCICPHRLQFSTTCNDTDLVLFHTELPFDQESKNQEVGLHCHLRHISVLHPEKVDIAIVFAGKNINFLFRRL